MVTDLFPGGTGVYWCQTSALRLSYSCDPIDKPAPTDLAPRASSLLLSSFPFSFTFNRNDVAVWWPSKSSLAPSLFLFTGFSPNKFPTHSFFSWFTSWRTHKNTHWEHLPLCSHVYSFPLLKFLQMASEHFPPSHLLSHICLSLLPHYSLWRERSLATLEVKFTETKVSGHLVTFLCNEGLLNYFILVFMRRHFMT